MIFDHIKDRPNQLKNWIEKIQSEGKPVAIYGAGYSGGECFNALKYAGTIKYVCDDDPEKIGKLFHGHVISPVSELPKNEDYYIVITNGFVDKMQKRIQELGLADKLIDIDFGRYDAENENYAYYKRNREKVEAAFELLGDDRSREVFIKMINYKIHRDRSEILDICESGQYFDEKLVPFSGEEFFVDLGAFDGDTVQEFIQKVDGRYEGILALEPSERNYKKLLTNFGNVKNVHCYNVGAWSENTILKFEVPDSKNSYVSDDGNCSIETVSLDDLCREKHIVPTFIKADIEGAEQNAIQGMKNIIGQYRPKLALCVYHKIEDLFEIPLLIHSYSSSYRYYLRQYAPSAVETVLYCIPK